MTDVQVQACCSAPDACSCGTCECPSVLSSVLDNDTATSLAAGFAALADPVRLRLVSLLATTPDGGVCVCDLVGPLGKSQSTVSHHVKVLADAGLIVGERHGRMHSYRIVPERLEALRNALSKEHTHA
jgi:ArsR family transcriptional regulator, arsenate/arsenite/antimonite-responsive transcriptional repressor